MRIFIIGNAETIWMKEYIKNIHIENKREIYLTAYEPLSKEYVDEYMKYGVNIVQLGKSNSPIEKIKKLVRLILFVVVHRFHKKFDYVDVQCPPHSSQALLLGFLLKFLNVKTVISFWGSDILRLKDEDAWKLEAIIKESNIINISTPEMLDKFQVHFGQQYNGSIIGAKFGSLAFSYIDKIRKQYSKEQCKTKLGIDSQKMTIAVGYNGRREHQHILVLDALNDIPGELKSKLFIVLHMGYGLDTDYYKEVKDAADRCGIEYKIITKHFELEDVAILRMATDVFLHAQISDALSGSIRECIYSGAILVNPEWIQYSEYDNNGVKYVTYSSFNEISGIMKEIIENKVTIDIPQNIKIVGELFSWGEVRKDWEKIFNEGTY